MELAKNTMMEEQVIGYLIRHPEMLDEARGMLSDDSFADSRCNTLYKAMCYVADEQNAVPDIVYLTSMFDQLGRGEDSQNALAFHSNCATDNITQCIEVLESFRKKRVLQNLGMRLMGAGDMDEVEGRELLDAAINDFEVNSASNIIDKVGLMQHARNVINENLGPNKPNKQIFTGLDILDKQGGLPPATEVVVAAFSSQGKALRMDELVLTTTGWKKNKDLQIGDSLASVDGEESHIIGIFPQGVKPMYRMKFADGREAYTSGDHLWEINLTGYHNPKILTTLEIKNYIERDCSRLAAAYTPTFGGQFGTHKDFILHPYVLGVLLGDGCLTRGACFCTADEFVRDKVASLVDMDIHEDNLQRRTAPTYRISNGRNGFSENKYVKELKRLGIYNHRAEDKFIPAEYLDADYDQRLQLLQGLMDTDGEVDVKNHCIHYSTISEQLAKDVQYLVRSIGLNARVNRHKSAIYGKEYRDHYRVTISGHNEEIVCTLPRRKERIKKRSRVNNTIQSVEYVGEEECQCIAVSHPRSLFIIRDFVVTHNTSMGMTILNNAMINGVRSALYSMEMGRSSIAARFLNMMGWNVPTTRFKTCALQEPTIRDFDHLSQEFINRSGDLYLDEKSNNNADKICASIRVLHRTKGVQLVMIDYLQIIPVYDSSGSSDQEQLAKISRKFQAVAKELDICIIVLSQFSRPTKGQSHEPSEDLIRGSGQIFEACDIALYIYRPFVWKESYPSPYSDADTDGTAYLKIGKYRDGIVGDTCICGFDANRTLFYDFKEGEYDQDPKKNYPKAAMLQTSNSYENQVNPLK